MIFYGLIWLCLYAHVSNLTGNWRLSALTVLSIHGDLGVDLNDVLDIMAAKKSRKLKIFTLINEICFTRNMYVNNGQCPGLPPPSKFLVTALFQSITRIFFNVPKLTFIFFDLIIDNSVTIFFNFLWLYNTLYLAFANISFC